MKTREVVRYALMLILIVLLLRALPFLWAVFWYSLPLLFLLFFVFLLVVFFDKYWVLSTAEEEATGGDYDAAHSWRSQLYQFLLLVKEQRVIHNLWKIFIRALILVMVVTALAYYLGKSYWQGRNTQTEINQISQALEQYRSQSNGYPEKLEILIGNNPLKRDWETDGWGNNYAYEVAPDKQKFSLVSKGKDGMLRTSDDISVK